MMSGVIEIKDLTRTYRKRRSSNEVVALDRINLTIFDGQIHGLLGPSGAGKSTLIKILSTMLVPTSGSVSILGYDVVSRPQPIRAAVGVVMGGERGLYTRVSARQNLMFWAALYHLDRATAVRRCADLLHLVGLGEWSDDPVERYSRGMKQRLHLARGLLHNPRILLLDEPTSGMDPAAAYDFRELIRELQRHGRTILMATHDMAEAEDLCGHVSLIDRSRLMLTEPVTTISRVLGSVEVIDFTCADPALVNELAVLPVITKVVPGRSVHTWRAHPISAAHTAQVLIWLINRGVLSASRSTPTLEEVYLAFVGARGMAL
jgi:ABC-2 type transport system ATP-binding protein